MQMSNRNLRHQLEAFRASFLLRLPDAERERIDPANASLLAAINSRPCLRVGDLAPDFCLPDQHGTVVRLPERLVQGPVVLLFVRGGWCPFCTLTLRAYQEWLPAIHDAGGDLMAVTPQPASTCCLMAERDLLAFQTLSDQDNHVSEQYGVAFELDPTLRPMYQRLGHDLPRLNATTNWKVPLPATFVIGRDRRIVVAHVEPALHQRLDPSDAVAALTALSRKPEAA